MSMSTDNEDQLTRGEIWEKSRRYAFIPPTFDTLREEETAFMKDLSNLWVRIQLCLEWVDEPWEYRQLQVREINELREHLKAGDEICRYLRERQSQMRRIWRTEIARAKDVITEFDKRIESPDDDEVGWRSAEELCEDVARLSTTSWILDLKLSNDKSDLESAISCFNAAFGGDRMEVSPRFRSALGHSSDADTHTRSVGAKSA